MKKLIIILLTIHFSLLTIQWCEAQIIHVPADQPTIQAGIDAAADGDTVLVDPGTYVENINFTGKNITVASLCLTTQDTSFISQTIIDGNQEGSVVTFANGEDSTTLLSGFSLVKGTGYYGGGINCSDASPVIQHLKILNCYCYWSWYAGGEGGGMYFNNSGPQVNDVQITDCWAPAGGGVSVYSSTVILQDVTIANNEANGNYYWTGQGGGISCYESDLVMDGVIINNNSAGNGGGICCNSSVLSFLGNSTVCYNSAEFAGGIYSYGEGSQIIFDGTERGNIYLNTADQCQDIYSTWPVHMVLDTFSVLAPTAFYAEPIENFTWDIQYGMIQQVNADLYVSPGGDDSNSGLTAADPLKTIYRASSKILADSLNPHTIFLTEGTYSPGITGEHFPLVLPDYITLSGASETTTVLDAEVLSGVVKLENKKGIALTNLTLTGGRSVDGGGLYCQSTQLFLQNVLISGNESYSSGWYDGSGGGIYCNSSEITAVSVNIRENNTNECGGGIYARFSALIFQDVVIQENEASYHGGGIYADETTMDFQDVLINNNTGTYYGGALYSVESNHDFTDVIIENNLSQNGGGLYVKFPVNGMSGMTIRNNKAYQQGGGLYCAGDSSLAFDPADRCNIYLNMAFTGNDLFTECPVNVVVDTFSVLVPTSYYAEPLELFSFDILNGKIEQVMANLYVSPLGDNENSGLTPDDPLRTIHFAQNKILADSLNPRVVHLASGTYSPGSNGEYFPVIMQEHITLAGQPYGTSVLDAEQEADVIYLKNRNHIGITNLTIQGGGQQWPITLGYGVYCENSSPELDDLIIRENAQAGIYCSNSAGNFHDLLITENYSDGMICADSSSPSLTNIQITNNENCGLVCRYGSSPVLNEVEITGNQSSGLYCENEASPVLNNVLINSNEGGGLYCWGGCHPILTNVSIRDNTCSGVYLRNSKSDMTQVQIENNIAHSGAGIYCGYGSDLTLLNSTIAYNHYDPMNYAYGGGIYFDGNAIASLENVIIKHNDAGYGSGGGIYMQTDSAVTLKNTTISHNSANNGGGIYISSYSYDVQKLYFDSINRCNIYMNNADYGNDLACHGEYIYEVFLDTFTVMYPTDYHAYPVTKFSFDIRHGLIEQVDADLYISPSGNDNNSGLTEEDPLRTIRHSISKLVFDSLHQNTVHLMEGTYGPYTSGESFPILIPNYFHLEGISQNQVILDGVGESGILYFNDNATSIITNLTIKGSGDTYQGAVYCIGSSPQLQNLTVTHNQGPGIYCSESAPVINNLTISSNNGAGIECWASAPVIQNSTFSNNWGPGIECINGSYAVINDVTIMANHGSGVSCSRESSPELTDVVITGNYSDMGGGIYCTDRSSPVIKNVEISHNEAMVGGGIYCAGSSSPHITQTTITGNVASEWGGGACIFFANPVFEDVLISENMAADGGGIAIKAYPDAKFFNVTLTENVASNFGGGIYMFYGETYLSGMLIAGNHANEGGAVYCDVMSAPRLTNLTMVNNEAGLHGGGIYCSRRSEPVLANAIMWNNWPEEIYFNPEEDASAITVTYSDIQGGKEGIETNDNGEVFWLDGNIDEDPMFSNMGEDPYTLYYDSPCIDAGMPDTTGFLLPVNDLIGNSRVYNNRIDMGAYEWDYVGVDEFRVPGSVFRVEVYPNPTNGVSSFGFRVSGCQHVSLKIYDVHGHEVATVMDRVMPAGEHVVSFDAGSLPAGVYVWRQSSADSRQSSVGKLVKY